MMRRLLILAILLLLGVAFSFGTTGVRFDLGGPIAGVSTISAQPSNNGQNADYLIVLAPVSLNWCAYPANSIQGVPCTNYSPTYTDLLLGTPCPSTQPIVLQQTNVCVSFSDALGNLGVNAAAGTYTYTLTSGSTTYGPYTVTLGGSSAGGGGITITTVAGLALVPVKTNGTLATVTNGANASDCTVGGGVFLVNCQYNGSIWSPLTSATGGNGCTYTQSTSTVTCPNVVVTGFWNTTTPLTWATTFPTNPCTTASFDSPYLVTGLVSGYSGITMNNDGNFCLFVNGVYQGNLGAGVTLTGTNPFTSVNSFSGTTTLASANGVLNPAMCSTATPPSWCSPGLEIGGWTNAAIAALPGQCGKIFIPSGTYSQNTTILKPRCVSMKGAGRLSTVLNWTPTAGNALVIEDSTGTSIYPEGEVSDLTLNGSGTSHTADGVYLGGDPNGTTVKVYVNGVATGTVIPTTAYGDHNNFNRVSIQAFNNGVRWGNNAWSHSFNQSLIAGNNVGVNSNSGGTVTGSGEAESFIATRVQNNLTSGFNLEDYADFYIDSGSCDFNPVCLVITGAVQVRVQKEHFEQNSGNMITIASFPDYRLHLTVANSSMVYDQASGTQAQAIAVTTGSGNSVSVDLDDVWAFVLNAGTFTVTNLVNWSAPVTGSANILRIVEPHLVSSFPGGASNLPCSSFAPTSGCTIDDPQHGTLSTTGLAATTINGLTAPSGSSGAYLAELSGTFTNNYPTIFNGTLVLNAATTLFKSAAYTPSTAGLFGYDSTNNRFVGGNGTNTSFLNWIASTASITTGHCAQFTGTKGQLVDAGAACGTGGGSSGNGPSGSTGVGIVTTTTNGYAPLYGNYSASVAVANVGNIAQSVGAVANAISQLSVTLGTAVASGKTLTVTLYDVTAASAQAVTCTVAALATTCTDVTHSYSAPAGDTLAWQVVGTASLTTNLAIGAQVGSASTFSGNTPVAVSQGGGGTTQNDLLSYDANGNAVDSGNCLEHYSPIPGSSDQLTGAGTFATTIALTAGVPGCLVAGSVLTILGHGTGNAAGTENLALQIGAGGNSTICPAPTAPVVVPTSAFYWDAICYIQINTTGNPGTAFAWGAWQVSNVNGGSIAAKTFAVTGVSTVAFNTVTPGTVNVQASTMTATNINLLSLDTKVIH
jgi:hypothetical protein